MTEKQENTALPANLLALVGGTACADVANREAEFDYSTASADATPYSLTPPICISQIETASDAANSAPGNPYACISQDDSAQSAEMTSTTNPCIAATATPVTLVYPICISQDDSAQSAEMTSTTNPCIAASDVVLTFPPVCYHRQPDSAEAGPISWVPTPPFCIAEVSGASDVVFTLPSVCIRGPASESASASDMATSSPQNPFSCISQGETAEAGPISYIPRPPLCIADNESASVTAT